MRFFGSSWIDPDFTQQSYGGKSMTSLVDHLRELSANMLKLDLDMRLPAGNIDPAEAADRIEDLERENAELREWRQMLGKQLQNAIADCASARRDALEEAARIADEHAKAHCSGMGSETEAMRIGSRSIAAAIRALSDSSPTLLQEQNANGGKEEG
jgi:urease accessory protein UreF